MVPGSGRIFDRSPNRKYATKGRIRCRSVRPFHNDQIYPSQGGAQCRKRELQKSFIIRRKFPKTPLNARAVCACVRACVRVRRRLTFTSCFFFRLLAGTSARKRAGKNRILWPSHRVPPNCRVPERCPRTVPTDRKWFHTPSSGFTRRKLNFTAGASTVCLSIRSVMAAAVCFSVVSRVT